MMAERNVVDDGTALDGWFTLPRRIYLDTSTLQTIFDFGEEIFDGVSPQAEGPIARVEGLAEEIDALRSVFLVNQRAMFEFVVTNAAMREVVARGHEPYARWVFEVSDTWAVQSSSEEAPAPGTLLRDRRFGMLSVKDRALLQEALDWRCQAFLTMERRLPQAAVYLQAQTGLRVVRPSDYWRLLAPWARIYY